MRPGTAVCRGVTRVIRGQKMDYVDRTLAEMEEEDFEALWDADYQSDPLKAAELDFVGLLDGSSPVLPGVILNDRLMTEASLGMSQQWALAASPSSQPAKQCHVPRLLKIEHCYSLASEQQQQVVPRAPPSPLSDLESECYPAIPIREAGGDACLGAPPQKKRKLSQDSDEDNADNPQVSSSPDKQRILEQRIPKEVSFQLSCPPLGKLDASDDRTPQSDAQAQVEHNFEKATKTLNYGGNCFSAFAEGDASGNGYFGPSSSAAAAHTHASLPSGSSTSNPGVPTEVAETLSCATPNRDALSGFFLPLTPPSCSGSDTESGDRTPPQTPPPIYEILNAQFCNPKKTGHRYFSNRNPINTPLISSQPKGATGALNLTEEEKRTLISEGYAVPSRLPLSKMEERSLKKVRRKIKNKISAQESRRKKKEYMDTLERKVEMLKRENLECRRKVDALQNTNCQLAAEVRRLQACVKKDNQSLAS